jgi:hypothetical protein
LDVAKTAVDPKLSTTEDTGDTERNLLSSVSSVVASFYTDTKTGVGRFSCSPSCLGRTADRTQRTQRTMLIQRRYLNSNRSSGTYGTMRNPIIVRF